MFHPLKHHQKPIAVTKGAKAQPDSHLQPRKCIDGLNAHSRLLVQQTGKDPLLKVPPHLVAHLPDVLHGMSQQEAHSQADVLLFGLCPAQQKHHQVFHESLVHRGILVALLL